MRVFTGIIVLVVFLGCAHSNQKIDTTTTDRGSETTITTETQTLTREEIIEFSQIWEKDYVIATAFAPIPVGETDSPNGRLKARDSAMLIGYANLYRQIGEVYITEDITIVDYAVNTTRTSELQGYVHQAEIIQDKWSEQDSVYQITLRVATRVLVEELLNWEKTTN